VSSAHVPGMGLETGRLKLPLPYLLNGFLIAAAFTLQLYLGLNPDTTWLTVMAERWLGGERLFIDLHENNPPASVYLYIPAVYAGKLMGIRSELVVQVFTILLFMGCVYCTFKMLVRAGYERHFHFGWLLTVCVILFLLMPVSSYGQREHLAALLTLPLLGLAAIRCAGKRPDVWMVVLSGLALGCIGAIKPPLISIAVLLSLLAAFHSRSWRVFLAPENWIGAAVFATYLAAIVFLHPAFVRDVMPLLRDVYLPARFFVIILLAPAFWVMVGLVVHSAMMHRADWVDPPICLVYAAASGYFFSYIMQMKFFDYHALPVAIFLMLALCMGILRLQPGTGSWVVRRTGRLTGLLIIGVLGGFNFHDFYSSQYNGNLTKVVQAINPAARVAGFGVMPGPQIRAVRDAGGSWVGSFGYTYVPGYAAWFRAHETVSAEWGARLDFWERWTADVSARDIAEKKPDIILFLDEKLLQWPTWLKQYPQMVKAMSNYRFYSKADVGKGKFPVLVYVRSAHGIGARPLSEAPAGRGAKLQ
jgi:hypothetical protein